jgi:hypothetical protein
VLTRALQFYQLLRLGSVIGASILLAKSGLSLADIGAYEALLYIGSAAAFFLGQRLVAGVFHRCTPEWRSWNGRRLFSINFLFLESFLS